MIVALTLCAALSSPLLCTDSMAPPPLTYETEVETAIDGKDSIHVVYTPYSLSLRDFRIGYLKVDGRSGRVVIRPLVLPSLNQSISPAIVVEESGYPHITFLTRQGPDNPAGMTYLKLNKEGSILVEQELPVPSFAYCLDMAIDPLERIYVLWWDWTLIHYHLLDRNGKVLREDQTEPPEGYEFVLDRTQYDIHVLEEGYSSSDYYWALGKMNYSLITTNDGRGILVRESGHDFHETEIVDLDGNVHFLFRADDMPPLEDNGLLHHYKTSPEGDVLMSNDDLTPGVQWPLHPSAELDSGGNIHLVWWGTADRYDVFYMKLTENGHRFFAPYPILKETEPSSPLMSLLTDPIFIIVTFATVSLVVVLALRSTVFRKKD